MSSNSDKPRSLADILSGTSVGTLARRAAATDRLARQVVAALPPEVGPHVLGANLREGRLVVIGDGAVWAARVRFELPTLREALSRDHEIDVTGLSVKVRAPDPPASGAR